MMRDHWERSVALGCVLLGAVCLSGCEPDVAPDHAPASLAVTVTQVATRELSVPLQYTAVTQGSREIEVRARVSGIVLKRLYKEGSAVRAGQILFQIDPAPFAARVAQSRAAVAVAEATVAQAQRNRDRVLPLVEKGLLSTKERDDVLSALEVADAQAQAARAALRSAELDLEYTEVRAPIGGVAGREQRSEGSLVTAGDDSSLLTRIVQVDPLYVEFAAPEAEAGVLRAALRRHAVTASVNDASRKPIDVELTFIDNEVDDHTSTVRLRAVMTNRTQQFWPGQIVRVALSAQSSDQVVALPREVVLTDASGYYVWVIDQQQQVQRRSVQLGVMLGAQVVVADGLQAGEQVAVSNLFQLKPGQVVRTQAAQLAAATTGAG